MVVLVHSCVKKQYVQSTLYVTSQYCMSQMTFRRLKMAELLQVLESMGVGDLFRSSADLSTLTGESGLQLDTIIHRAKVTVDETGSEAAAATAIFANRFSSDSFIADHPFVFFLFHKKSNTLLFSGVFNSPTK